MNYLTEDEKNLVLALLNHQIINHNDIIKGLLKHQSKYIINNEMDLYKQKLENECSCIDMYERLQMKLKILL